jgi:hypothetical protein
MQKNRDYLPTLKTFVDGGDFKNDKTFIGLVNRLLVGSQEDISRRTKMFHHALRAFNLIPVETNSTVLPIGDGQGDRYCGVNYKDAESRCEPCVTNFDCRGKTLCHSEVGACNPNIPSALDRESTDSITSASSDYENSGDDVVDTPMSPMAMVADAVTTLTTNYCGGSWGDAATTCAKACEFLAPTAALKLLFLF